MVPSPFQPEGMTLPNGIPLHFERFYRENLRRVIGARVRSSTVQTAYTTWADREDAQSVSYHELRRYMLALGHRHVKSNGIHYRDAAFASDVPDTPDTFAVFSLDTIAPGGVDATVAAIDGATVALARLRRALTGAS
jgi:hypothetical protein